MEPGGDWFFKLFDHRGHLTTIQGNSVNGFTYEKDTGGDGRIKIDPQSIFGWWCYCSGFSISFLPQQYNASYKFVFAHKIKVGNKKRAKDDSESMPLIIQDTVNVKEGTVVVVFKEDENGDREEIDGVVKRRSKKHIDDHTVNVEYGSRTKVMSIYSKNLEQHPGAPTLANMEEEAIADLKDRPEEEKRYDALDRRTERWKELYEEMDPLLRSDRSIRDKKETYATYSEEMNKIKLEVATAYSLMDQVKLEEVVFNVSEDGIPGLLGGLNVFFDFLTKYMMGALDPPLDLDTWRGRYPGNKGESPLWFVDQGYAATNYNGHTSSASDMKERGKFFGWLVEDFVVVSEAVALPGALPPADTDSEEEEDEQQDEHSEEPVDEEPVAEEKDPEEVMEELKILLEDRDRAIGTKDLGKEAMQAVTNFIDSNADISPQLKAQAIVEVGKLNSAVTVLAKKTVEAATSTWTNPAPKHPFPDHQISIIHGKVNSIINLSSLFKLDVGADEATSALAAINQIMQRRAIVLWDFPLEGEERTKGDLALAKGQTVVLLEAEQGKDWWKGYLESDGARAVGIFPRDFVEETEELEAVFVPPPPTEFKEEEVVEYFEWDREGEEGEWKKGHVTKTDPLLVTASLDGRHDQRSFSFDHVRKINQSPRGTPPNRETKSSRPVFSSTTLDPNAVEGIGHAASLLWGAVSA